ncbi:MAG: MFS transporter [Clostridia bacterium]|nr:MFS transporter [Clostridia bacterium]
MATLLLIVIFTAYIGLGVPDSLFGSAWPAICESLNVSESSAWMIVTPISCFTLLSSILSAKIIEILGAKWVSIISTFLTAVALFGTSFSQSPFAFILWGIPLGFGGGAIDSALNNYVALHYKASHMNFLHCFYGVGVAISPYIMSVALSFTTWRDGYKIASVLQLVIAFITLFSLPLWKVHNQRPNEIQPLNEIDGGSYKELFKNHLLVPVCLIFLFACAVEVTAGTWATTYLVTVKHATKSQGAFFLMFYYTGLALGRFLSGILSAKLSINKINALGMVIVSVGVVALIIPTSFIAISVVGLFLIGLGIGPIYPNFSFLTPRHFGENASQKAMGLQMAGAFIGVLVPPTIMGILADFLGMGIFPIFVLIALISLAICYYIYLRIFKKYGKV